MDLTPGGPKAFEGFPTELIMSFITLATALTRHSDGDQCVGQSGRLVFPFTALYVSRRWKDITLSLPELWTTFRMCNRDPWPTITRRMQQHKDYSAGHPMTLDVQIKCHPGFQPALFLGLLRRQLEPKAPWRQLRVACEGYPQISFHHIAQGLMSLTKYPTLEELEITRSSREDVAQDPWQTAPHGALPQITNIARNCPLLRNLTFRGFKISAGAEPWVNTPFRTDIHFRRLRELCLQDVDWTAAVRLVALADLPILHTVAISISGLCPDYHFRWQDERVELPSLHTAVLYNFSPYAISYILRGCPNLNHLALAFNRMFESIGSLDPEARFDLVTLAIRQHEPLGDLRREIQKRWPRLERLVISEDTQGLEGSFTGHRLSSDEMAFSSIQRYFRGLEREASGETV